MLTRSPDWLIGDPSFGGKDDVRFDPFAKGQNIILVFLLACCSV